VLRREEQEQFVVGDDVLGVLASVADVVPDVDSEGVHVISRTLEGILVEFDHAVKIDDTVLAVGARVVPKPVEPISAIPHANFFALLKFVHILFVSGHVLGGLFGYRSLPVWGVAVRFDGDDALVSLFKLVS